MVRPEVSGGSEAQHALRATDLHKTFGAVTALSGVSFSIRTGEFVTLLGPSGCGKSTILRILAGIETPTRGAVTIGGEVVNDTERRILVSPERRDLSMVFQSYAVWPHMTVATNVAFPLRYRKVPRSERRERVTEALRAVRMEEYVDRYPHQLSGGQQQRVAVARSIVGHPALLLLDEPLSNLDARLREDMRVELKRLHLELGLTMLYVTHDQSEALAMSDRILVMDHGAGAAGGRPRGRLPITGIADSGTIPGCEEHRRRAGVRRRHRRGSGRIPPRHPRRADGAGHRRHGGDPPRRVHPRRRGIVAAQRLGRDPAGPVPRRILRA